MIHFDECSVEKGTHSWVLTDLEGDVVASIPFEVAHDETDAGVILEQVVKGYNKGYGDGEYSGKLDLQADLRRLLGAAMRA